MCVMGGNEFILPWFSAKKAYFDLKECYEKGIITDERLDEAVKRVLEAQHKVLEYREPKYTEITESDVELFKEINYSSVYARTDEGVKTAISRDGKHFFVVLVKNDTEIKDDGKVTVDTFTQGWYFPGRITRKIEELFPNSTVRATYQFPTPNQNMDVLQDSLGYDDVIFVTFTEAPAYAGSDHLTHRIVALINAMLNSGRVSTLLHFGNPYPLYEISHVERLLIGGISADSIDVALEILAGEREAKGKLTYKVDLQ